MNNHETNSTEETKKVLDEKELEEVSGGEEGWMTDEEALEITKRIKKWPLDEKTNPFDFELPDSDCDVVIL